MHIIGVHILCLGWINNVHIAKCVDGVHLLCFLFNILTWAFMFKLLVKLQPPKNFKYKYLFNDKILKGDGASSSHDDDLLLVPFVVEH